LEKSLIFGGDQYQRELDSVTKKIDDLGSLIEDSETIRQSLLEKIESLENQRIKALELYSSFWRKIVSLEKNAETLRSGIQDALEDEGYFIRD
jgi:chromosome segregation ATPase